MSERVARIRVASPRRDASGAVLLEGDLAVPGREIPRITFAFTHGGREPALPLLRPFLLAYLPVAMRLGLPIATDRPLDDETHRNLMTWQAAWAAWRPGRLSAVPVLAPRGGVGRGEDASPRGHLSAFSGGVDSCFTVWRQAHAPDSSPVLPIRGCLFVRGFDVPHADRVAGERAHERARKILDSFGIPLYSLATDVRVLERACDLDWETETHGIWLGAALACLESSYEGVVVPSTFTYDCLRLPWGSNPIGDPLLGSDRVPFRHDGAECTKLDKVTAMAADPAIARGVRVCYHAPSRDENCGHCYKCITTQVSFWLAGVPAPCAFPEPCTPADLASMPIEFEQHDFLVAQIVQRALEAGRDDIARPLSRARRRWRRRRRRRARRERG